MKGKILEYNIQNSEGVISGDDGKRYKFKSSNWKSDKSPDANQIVDFSIDGENATDIYLDKPVNNINLSKNKLIAALLAFFLGAFGFHKFYLGCTTAGLIMLIVSLLGFILLWIPTLIIGIIAFIEAIMYIIKSDEAFEDRYVTNKRCWF